MRTVLRLCLAATLVAAVGLVAVPTASASTEATGQASITAFEKKQNRKIRKAKRKARRAHARIENLKEWNFVLDAHNRRQDDSFSSLQGIVNAILAGVPDIVEGLEALEEGLLAVDAALNDESTGLVGLNLARPQFGVFDVDGSFLGGTSDAGGSGPTDDASTVAGGFYIVDFENDVSTRVFQVNVFPDGASAAPVARVGSCATAGIDALCEGIEAGSSGDGSEVVVQFGDGSTAPTTAFQLTAISG